MEEKKSKNKKIIIWTIGIITIITLLGTIGKTNSPKNTNKIQINKTSQYTKTQSTVSQNKEKKILQKIKTYKVQTKLMRTKKQKQTLLLTVIPILIPLIPMLLLI